MFFWALVNLGVSSGCFYLVKAPLMRAYLLLNFILIVQPVFLFRFFGLSHPLFQPGNPNYSTSLIFLAFFNIILCFSFRMFMRSLPRMHRVRRIVLRQYLNVSCVSKSILIIVAILAAIGVSGKFLLASAGAFRMNDNVTSPTANSLQFLKSFSSFDLIAIVFLGEFRLTSLPHRRRINLLLLSLIFMSLYFALFSGSRSQVVTVLILAILAYRDVVKKNWIATLFLLLIGLPSLFMIFPLLGYYRNFGFSFSEAFYQLESAGQTAQSVMNDVLITRLNYNETYVRVFNAVQSFGPSGGSIYLNNIVGLIPRIIWPDKPLIYNDSRVLGHIFGLVTANDETTSIGLQVVGEAFYEFGWLGLWVAVFQAFIFTLIHKNFFVPHNRVSMTIYIFSSLYILQRDGYFSVIPGLAWLSLSFLMFFGFAWASLYGSRRRTRR